MGAATLAFAPFENLSGDPAQDYFARGFVEDVATELSRFGTVEIVHSRAVASIGTSQSDLVRVMPADHLVTAASAAPGTASG